MIQHLWVVLAAMSAAFFGAALVHGFKGNGLWFSVNLFISTCCMVGSLIVYFLTKEEDETPPAVGAMPNSTPTPVYRVRDGEGAVYDPRPTFIEGLGHGAGKIAEAAGEVGASALRGISDAYRRNYQFFLGVTFSLLAIISFMVGMMGIVTTWKGLHAGVVFGLIATTCFLISHQALGGMWQRVRDNGWLALLLASAFGFIITWCHNNWPQGPLLFGFFLSGARAITGLYGAWGDVREFLTTWLFRKDWFSLSIWAGAVATIALIAFLSGNWREQLSERIGVGVILLIAIILAIASLMVGIAKRTGGQEIPTNQ